RWSDATGRALSRKVPMEDFRVLLYISSSFPKLCLAQSHRPTYRTPGDTPGLSAGDVGGKRPYHQQATTASVIASWNARIHFSPSGEEMLRNNRDRSRLARAAWHRYPLAVQDSDQ